MIIHTTNILTGPLLLGIWAIDIYLFLAAARLVLGRLSSTCNGRVCLALKLFTDPIPGRVLQRLQQRRASPVPLWQPWVIVLGSAVVIRHLLAWTLVGIS